MMMMNKTEIHKNFIIEYHPSQKKKWKKKLVGFDKMKALINDDDAFALALQRIGSFTGDTLWLRVSQGLAFHIRWR